MLKTYWYEVWRQQRDGPGRAMVGGPGKIRQDAEDYALELSKNTTNTYEVREITRREQVVAAFKNGSQTTNLKHL